MKKILILSHTGSESHFKIGSHHYANELSKKGYEVSYIGAPNTIIHRIFGRHTSGERKIDSLVINKDLRFIFPITLKYNIAFVLFNLILHKITHKEDKDSKFDLVICDYPFFSPYLNLFTFDKMIYRPTDTYLFMTGGKVKLYEKKIIKLASHIVATSDKVAEDIKDIYGVEVENKNISVLSNGYEHDLFFKSDDILKKTRNGSVYIGALDYRFDFDALESLARNYKNDKFDIFGPISKGFNNKILELSNKYKNIHFYGEVSYTKIPEILLNYKVGLLLLNDNNSNYGRSPMKLWEYAAAGLHILYTKIIVNDIYSFLHYYDESDMFLKYTEAKNAPLEINEINKIKKYSWDQKTEYLIQKIISEDL